MTRRYSCHTASEGFNVDVWLGATTPAGAASAQASHRTGIEYGEALAFSLQSLQALSQSNRSDWLLDASTVCRRRLQEVLLVLSLVALLQQSADPVGLQ